jgi:SAM-dependent methyltransferase
MSPENPLCDIVMFVSVKLGSLVALGHVLLFSILRRNVRKQNKGLFLDIGGGTGIYSNQILKIGGWCGKAIESNLDALAINQFINSDFIMNGSYEVIEEDAFTYLGHSLDRFDLVLASCVIEHFDDSKVKKFFEGVREILNENGRLIVIVPGSPGDWGPEDELHGHEKRYTINECRVLGLHSGLTLEKVCGATYPLSNFLLRLSNFLVKREESKKASLSTQERTLSSGFRRVKFKTEFPTWSKLIINKVVLSPFILLQFLFKNHPKSLMIYASYLKV